MNYQERLPPEGINASQENPLKEFVLLLTGLLLVTVLLVSVAIMFADKLAKYVPFDVEVRMARGQADPDTTSSGETARYIAELTASLAAASELPEGMTVTSHYADSDIVNAYATLGGNIVIYRGLVEKMPSENALAMVIAHEIAHIKHRDPIASLSRGVLVQLVLAAITGGGDAGYLIGKSGLLTMLSFNREMEEDADEQAMRTLNARYGHVGGATELFEILRDGDNTDLPEFFSTHPLGTNRIEHLQALALQHGWAARGQLTALPLATHQAGENAPP